ncbi:toprim domain-containing protein [Vibrio natriegens]|uniref:toprim domain-containing protein n=1 Tax=Vibrio natriegens TaxID=691 RepID=UPI0021E807FE|nr:toprim domain-containing protein [Vibrio natriegens]UYI46956.1 toprim domain-containing protein [Vibrio natriegens]
MLILDHFSGFTMAVTDAGLTAPKEIINDGQIHRFSSNGKSHDTSGYYAFFSHPNGFNAGFFGCWRTGIYSTWTSKHASTLTEEERSIVKRCQEEAKVARDKVYTDRAQYANDVWKNAVHQPRSHSYLAAKKITEHGNIAYMPTISCCDFFMDESRTTQLRDALLIPLYDQNGNIQSLQAITPNGKKFFMKGGKMTGGRFTFSGTTETVYLCEGYATGASLHQLTNATVVVTFTASNLENVASTINTHYPDSVIVIAADNDHQKEKEGKGNKGIEVAKLLLENHQFAYTSPLFDTDDHGTDWNDFCNNNSAEDALRAIMDNLVKPPATFDNFDECIDALKQNPFDEEAFDCAIDMIKSASRVQQGDMRKKLKAISGADMGDIRKAIGEALKRDQKPDLTHSQIAESYLKRFGKTQPVGACGKLYFYDPDTGIWKDTSLTTVGVEVSKLYAEEPLCRTKNDYNSIASHIYDSVANEEFFGNAPAGLVTPDGFIYADDKQLKRCEPSPEHRARFVVDIKPCFEQEPTKLLSVLREAFKGCHQEEQIRQLQMLTGMTLLGLLQKEQRAVFLHGTAGSGKSLYLSVLGYLIPNEFCTSVSPLDLDCPYNVAALAGKLLNTVPEIDKEKPVPSAQFKAITGGDSITARQPYGKVFPLNAICAHWYNGNFYLTTKDHTEGFWRRWAIIHFANTKSASERNPNLLDEILAKELPAILGWALKGAIDYLESGLYLSPAHHACLAEWRRDGNSVNSWLHAEEDNGIALRSKGMGKLPLRVTHAYQIYREWCQRNNRKPFNSQMFKVHMEGSGYATTKYNGYTCYDALVDARPGLGAVLRSA